MSTIFLAHGVLGFGDLPVVPTFAHYFNGVAGHLRRRGHTVIALQVNPIGSIAQRGDELARKIVNHLPNGGQAHIIAHSMGGLDARHAITNVFKAASPIRTLVTIGTPHRGSPVADAIATGTGPLLEHIPAFLVDQLRENGDALLDLTTAAAIRFDEITPDVPGVRYIEVAGNAALGSHELLLFQLAAAVGRLHGINDGVVTKSSAIRTIPNRAPGSDWPVDHAGEVGWSLTSPVPIEIEVPFGFAAAHLARYDAIVDLLGET